MADAEFETLREEMVEQVVLYTSLIAEETGHSNPREDFPGGGGLAVTEAKIRSALRARLTLPKK